MPGVRKGSKKLGGQMGQALWKKSKWDQESTHSAVLTKALSQLVH